MSGIFLTRAPSRSPIIKYFGVNVPAGTAVVVDTIAFVDRVTCRWVVTIKDPTTTEVQSYEVLGNHLPGAPGTPRHNKYGQIGNVIKNAVDVTVSGSNFQLEITNNETHDFTVDVFRIELTV